MMIKKLENYLDGVNNLPYIKQEQRDRLDWIIDNLASELSSMGITGNLNYVLYRLAKKLCRRYSDYAMLEGDVQSALREIYRKQVAPYENLKEKENGEIE